MHRRKRVRGVVSRRDRDVSADREGGGTAWLLLGMGVCFECLVEVDGVPGLRACRTTVKPGMRVRTEST